MAALKSKDVGDVLVVYFNDAKMLDEHQIAKTGKQLLELETEATVTKKMLVSFRGVDFMSSAMLGQLARLNKQAKIDKVNLKFCNISPDLMQVFKVMRLSKITFATEEQALKSFHKNGWFS